MTSYRKILLIVGTFALSIALGSFWLAYETPDRASAAGTEDVIPNATATETNTTCTTANAHTTLDDDPDAPGGDWCSADSDGVTVTIRTNMATPVDSDPVSTASEAQKVDVYVRGSKASGNGTPTLQIDYYCNGSLVESDTSNTVNSGTGEKLSATFTHTGACASDGSDVEILIQCAPNGGVPNEKTCDFDAVEWEATTAVAPSARQRAVTIPVALLDHTITYLRNGQFQQIKHSKFSSL